MISLMRTAMAEASRVRLGAARVVNNAAVSCGVRTFRRLCRTPPPRRCRGEFGLFDLLSGKCCCFKRTLECGEF